MTDADQFEAFVRRYQDMVFATAVRLLGNPAEAEDVAQTVFLKAFQRFDTIGQSPAAAGWLKTVTTNACLNHLSRYRARWRFFSELDRTDRDDSETPTSKRRSSRRARPRWICSRPTSASNWSRRSRRLPDHQRVPLVLFHFENISYQAIAELLGVSLGKVKTDIHRGREALKKHLSTQPWIPLTWTTLVDRELRQLPSPRAPHTLLPRVLAAVEQWTRRPWYARAWFTWPLGGRSRRWPRWPCSSPAAPC